MLDSMSHADKNIAVDVNGLSKSYPNGTVAVSDVSFDLDQGEILCVGGENGAGKTTLLRMIATQLHPSSGSIRLHGMDVSKNFKAVREIIACVPQGATPDAQLTVWEHVYYFLRLRGMHADEARTSADYSIRIVGLEEKRDHIVGTLSGGQRRRTLIALALGTKAKILMLDEPTAGLDPIARREFWGALRAAKDTCSVLITTHHFDEMSAIADRIILLSKGAMKAIGTPIQLVSDLGSKYRITCSSKLADTKQFRTHDFREIGGELVFYPMGSKHREEITGKLSAMGAAYTVTPVSLEDIYIKDLWDRK